VPRGRGREPVGQAVPAQAVDRPLLEEAGSRARLDVLAAALLDDDAVDSGGGQDVGEQQSGGPRTDDRDLRVPAHGASAAPPGERQSVGDGEHDAYGSMGSVRNVSSAPCSRASSTCA
jgi:hypothetical protein